MTQSVAPSVATIATKDIVTWVVTGSVLFINLCWNFWNFRRTTLIADSMRRDTFDLDEWKGHRATITTRLDDFEAAGDRLLTLTKGQHKHDDLMTEVHAEGKGLTMTHQALLRALERYGGENWEVLAYGTMQDGESDWDRLNTVLAELSSLETDADKIRASLHPIRDLMRSIAKCVTERIIAQTERHYPR